MSGPKKFRLQPIVIKTFYLEDAVKTIIHTILFNRALGLLKPTESYCNLLDICYAKIPSYDNDIIVDNIYQKIFNSGFQNFQINVSFYSKIKQPIFYGLLSNNKKNIWEQWCIQISLEKRSTYRKCPQDKIIQRQKTEKDLRNRVLQIINLINQHHSHMPITNMNIEKEMLFDFDIDMEKGLMVNKFVN